MSAPNHKASAMPTCPGCPNRESMIAHGSSLQDGNFTRWQCPKCGHQGTTAVNGTHLVFRGGDEYIFTFGRSMRSMTVKLSPKALEIFRRHEIKPEDMAQRMAEWMLLRGWSQGPVRLGSQTDELMKFYRYCYPDGADQRD